MKQKLQIEKTGFNMWEVRDEGGITIFEGGLEDCKKYIAEEKRRF